ncbi:MAG: LuxR C-terminal-related transcriptional regulator [Roseburia sp.]
MKKEAINFRTTYVVVMLALFNSTFLGIEYLFDNMMAYVTDSKGVVVAQSYVLGISVIGFLLFPGIHRFLKGNLRHVAVFTGSLIGIICIFVIQQHTSYQTILVSGCIAFVLLGIAGSAVHYAAACMLNRSRHLAKIVGFAYAVGIFLQFINNNFVRNDMTESIVLSVFLTVLAVLYIRVDFGVMKNNQFEKSGYILKNKVATGGLLVVIVALMTCIFASLDNAVTLVHASGSVDIGEWPRLLLALSGLTAGFLFDIKERRFMDIMMYCITLLSTICVVIIEFGGAFLIGLMVFYLSAGFFVVFFTTSFIDLSYQMKTPELWAGLGRAVNNICAVITSTSSVTLLVSRSDMSMMITAIILFVLISITVFIYSNQFLNVGLRKEQKQEEKAENEEERFSRFAETFELTEREQEVLRALLSSDDNVQEIADQLFMSRAALYRHIGNLNEKTKTKSRIGILQFYYAWAKGN